MTVDLLFDLAAGVLLVCGASLTLIAGIGVLRFPDLLARMHPATKPQVLGALLALAGMGLRLRSSGVFAVLFLVAIFQLTTAPVGAHMVGRAGYRTGKVPRDGLLTDELTDDLTQAREDGA